MTWLAKLAASGPRPLIAAVGTPLGRDGCMRGAGGCLLVKLVSS
jgi:hypothetical protein